MQWKDQSMLKSPALLLCNKDAIQAAAIQIG